MIRIEGLRVARNGTTICAVDELAVERGERVAIQGGNGSGKTTLLRVIAGLERDAAGRCEVDTAPRDRVYVHQNPYLFRGTVLRNVTYGLRARGVARGDREELAHAWLAKLGVDCLAKRRADHLSGGERRRVALARAMLLKPKLLLLDEPFAEMDADGERDLVRLLADETDATVLIATPTELPDGVARRTCVVERPA